MVGFTVRVIKWRRLAQGYRLVLEILRRGTSRAKLQQQGPANKRASKGTRNRR